MNIKWQDRVTNKEVFRWAAMTPLSKLIADQRLQLMGHTLRLSRTKAFRWIQDGEKTTTTKENLAFSYKRRSL